MQAALQLSEQAGLADRTDCFGAVVVKEGQIIGSGKNQVHGGSVRTTDTTSGCVCMLHALTAVVAVATVVADRLVTAIHALSYWALYNNACCSGKCCSGKCCSGITTHAAVVPVLIPPPLGLPCHGAVLPMQSEDRQYLHCMPVAIGWVTGTQGVCEGSGRGNTVDSAPTAHSPPVSLSLTRFHLACAADTVYRPEYRHHQSMHATRAPLVPHQGSRLTQP
jgi:hypothetical protein